MKNMNFYFLLGVSAIMIVTGMCIADVGEINSCGVVYDYTLPIIMFCCTAYFFLIGYFAGKKQ